LGCYHRNFYYRHCGIGVMLKVIWLVCAVWGPQRSICNQDALAYASKNICLKSDGYKIIVERFKKWEEKDMPAIECEDVPIIRK
jgi:hypothetical protein